MVSKREDPGRVPLDAGEAATRLDLAALRDRDPRDVARMLLHRLGRGDHPDALDNPVYALYQVAIDYRCSLNGYKTLYEMLRDEVSMPAETQRADRLRARKGDGFP